PRAVSRPRHDVADGVHGEGRGRSRRGLDRRPGSAERARRRRQSARHPRGEALSRHAGALDANGTPLAAHSNYTGGGNGEAVFMPYGIAAKKTTEKKAPHPIRLGQWRSVLNSQHGFFKESFIDEMAHAAGKDPFEFRRGLLADQPRFKAALEKAAALSGWGTPLPKGEGRGIAICESFGTIVAEVVHVVISPEG